MRLLLSAILLLNALAVAAFDSSRLLEGDLVFVVSDDANNPITRATVHDASALAIDHVAIAHRAPSGEWQVVEAVPRRGVVVTPWSDFEARVGRVVVGRLIDRSPAIAAVSRAMSYLGTPYDSLFMLDTNSLYCSELVQVCYRDADDAPLFPLLNMSFADAKGEILPYWLEFYHSRGMWVPQGALGSNPAAIARSPLLRLMQ